MVSARGRPLISPPHFAFFILSSISAAHGVLPYFTDSNRCQYPCHSPTVSYGLEEGYRYKYKYEGSSKMRVGASLEDLSPLDLTATVSITPLDACSFHVELGDIHLAGSNKQRLENDYLYKGEGGVVAITDATGWAILRLCAPQDQSTSYTNLHRAVLSLFQHSTHRLKPGNSTSHQRDVLGLCQGNYSIEENDEELRIHMTRNLDSCSYREEIKLPLITSPYQTKSEYSYSGIVKGTQTQEQKFLNKVLQEAKSHEFYTLGPVSDESAASVTVSSKLTFVTKTKATTEDNFKNYQKKAFFFESVDADEKSASYEDIKIALRKLNEGPASVVKEDSPRKFSSFTKKLAAANKQDILSLMMEVKEGRHFKNKMNAWRILLDGLADSASSTSVEIMSELITSGDVKGLRARTWLMGFSKVKTVTKEALMAAKEVLEKGVAPVQANLGIGALVGKFCAQNSCKNLEIVDKIEETMVKDLFESCSPTNIITENNLIIGLKGLGNIRYLSNKVANRISECALDKEAMVRVRVAALETMRTDSKKQIIQETAEKILMDLETDSEIRIKAYLTLVSHPSQENVKAIDTLLSTETSNQVRGFITSHISNIKMSTNPDKGAIWHHFSRLYNKIPSFQHNPKKYSKNYQLSYSNGECETELETNVIYSQESYLPRSLSFNLSTNLFGSSIHIFEVGVRTENIESMYEDIWKNLVLMRGTVNQILKDGRKIKENVGTKLSHTLRPKMNALLEKVYDSYNNMAKKPRVYHDEFLFDLSLKSLGAEVEFFTHYGNYLGVNRIMDQFLSGLEHTLDKALNVEYSKHSTFLEGEIIYPTGLGLPLKIKTKGSAAFGLAAETKMDIPSLLQKPYDFHNMKLKLIPSGSVEVIGTMTVDAGMVESGVEVTLSAQSSTGGDVSLKLSGGKELELVIGVPLREQKVISASTGLNTIFRQNNDVTVTPIELDIETVSIEEYSGCFEQLSALTGLTFCGDLSMPNNNKPTINPLYGPSRLSFSIHVEDDSIKTYVFKTSFEHSKEKNRKKMNMLFDTPGSQVNRRIFLGYESEIKPDSKQVKFMLESLWKSITVEGLLIEAEKEVSVIGKMKYKGKEYTTRAGLTIHASSEAVTVYKPFFHYSFPQEESRLPGWSKHSSPALKLSGEVLVERQKAEGLTTYLFNRLTIETQRSNYTLDGSISSQCKGESSSITSDLKIIYDEDYVTINGTMSRPDKTRLEGNIAVYPSQNPELAFSAQGRLENVINQDFKFLSEFDFTHGPDPTNKELKFTFNNHVLISGIREKNVKYIAIRHFVGYPPTNLLIESDLEWLPRNLKYKLGVKLDHSSADLKLTASTDPAGPYDIFIAAMLMDQGFKLDLKRELVENHKSKFTNSLELTPGKLFQANALVNHKFIWSDLDIGIQCEIKTPLQPKHIRLSTGAQYNKEKILGQFFLEADTKVFVDFFFERIKGPQSKGNFRFLLTDYVDSKGDFGFQDSVLKGSGFMIFLKSQNKIDAAVDMIIKYPKYAGTLGLNWSSSPENSKSIKITTDTDFDIGIFDTKNTLTYNGKENQFNFKFKRTGNNKKGTINADMEVKLGEDDHVTAKFSRNLNAVPGDADGEYNLEMSHKATSQSSPAELVLRLVGKHVDFDQGKIDGKLAITYASPEGKDVLVQLAHRKMPKDDKWTLTCSFDVSGSLVELPVNLKLESELSRTLFADSVSWSRFLPPSSYRILASFGKHTGLETYGKMTGNTFSGDITLKLPQEYKINSIKWNTINLVHLHPGPDNKRQVKTSNVFKWNQEFFEIDSEFVLEKDQGSIKFDWETDKTKKRSFHLASHWPKRIDGTLDFDVSFKYDKDGKPSDAFLKYSCNLIKGEGSLHFHGTCPANGVYDLKIASKRFDEKKGLHTEWILVTNNKTRKGLYKVISLADHPYVEFYMEDEDNTKSGFLIKADKKGTSEWTGNVHVEWPIEPGKKGFFYVNSEMKLISISDFLIKVEANSNKYQLKDWQLEVYSDHNSPQTTASRNVHFKMQHDSKILLNGTALYDLSYADEGLYRIEAEGDALFSGTLQPISLKAVWVPSSPGKGFNGSLVHGENTLSVESYFSDTQIYYLRKYCSKHINNCSEARIIWNSVKSGLYEDEKKLELVLDLSSMDPTLNDIILKANFKRDRNAVDHKIEFQWLKNKPFIYKAYMMHDKTGVTISLPQRTIAGDLVFQFPDDMEQWRLFIEGNLWLNKIKEPNKKTYLLLLGKVSRDIDEYALTTEAKLSHPVFPRELAVRGKATVGTSWMRAKSDGQFEIDLFKKPENTLIFTWSCKNEQDSCLSSPITVNLKSKGLNIDMGSELKTVMNESVISEKVSVYYLDHTGSKREASIQLVVESNKLHLSCKLPDVSMYEVSYDLELFCPTSQALLLGNYEIAGAKYKESIELINPHNISYQFHFGKDKTFSMILGLAYSQMVEFKTSFNEKPIFELGVSLNEENFLQLKHNYNNDNYRKLFEIMAEEGNTMIKNIDKEVRRAADRDGKALALLVSKLGKSMTDISPLFASYQQDLEALGQEIIDDEAIMKSILPVREILSSVVEEAVEITEELMQLTTHFRKALDELTDNIQSTVLFITDKIKETSRSISEAMANIVKTFFDVYLRLNDRIYEELNKYDAEIETIKKVISNFSKEMGQHMIKFMKQVKKEYDNFLRLSWEKIKEMPLFHLLEEKMKELKNYKFAEGFWPDIQEVLRGIEESAPNPELKKFINTLTNYIDMYLKEEKLDLDTAARQIYTEFVASIQPTIDSIYEIFHTEDYIFGSQIWVPLPWMSLWKAGKSSKYVKFAILSQSLPSVSDYIIQSWASMHQLLPPYQAKAYISGGEIVTYDEHEVSLSSGTYILAQELSQKFSIVAQIKDGAMTNIVLIQNNITFQYSHDGKLWVNGKIVHHTIKIGLEKPSVRYSLYGGILENEEVSIICEHNLKACRVILKAPCVFANVRGILGTYNYEYFDELTLPDGKISSDERNFVNSWKIDGHHEESEHHHLQHDNMKCQHLFNESTGFMLCFGFVNPRPFYDMCRNSVTRSTTPEAKKKALCFAAYHYTRACREKNIKIDIPHPCDVCEVDGIEVTTDEFKTIKTPARKADVVLLVELIEDNAYLFDSLVRPLVEQLHQKLGSRGITDVEYGLVGFGSKDLTYINYFKVDGKLQMKSLPSKLPWENLKIKIYRTTNATIFDNIVFAVDKYLVADDQTERGVVRSQISTEYPWRAGSSRSIIALVSSPCRLPDPILSPLTRIRIAQKLLTMKSYGIVYNLITPIQKLKLRSGKASEILGFTKDEAYLFSDFESGKEAKSRKDGLTVSADLCHLFPLETGGNVFVSENLKNGNETVDAVSTRITNSLLAEEKTFQCQCKISRGLHPKYECTVDI